MISVPDAERERIPRSGPLQPGLPLLVALADS